MVLIFLNLNFAKNRAEKSFFVSLFPKMVCFASPLPISPLSLCLLSFFIFSLSCTVPSPYYADYDGTWQLSYGSCYSQVVRFKSPISAMSAYANSFIVNDDNTVTTFQDKICLRVGFSFILLIQRNFWFIFDSQTPATLPCENNECHPKTNCTVIVMAVLSGTFVPSNLYCTEIFLSSWQYIWKDKWSFGQ